MTNQVSLVHDGANCGQQASDRTVSPHERDPCKSDGKAVQFALRAVFEPSPARLCVSDSVASGVQLHLVLAAYGLPMGGITDCPAPRCRKKEISYSAVYLHFAQWSRDGSFKRLWQQSIRTIRDELDLSELNLDGTHSLAKKGGESVAYQGRKKGKTCNILPIMDKHGYVVASTGIIAGQHNDAFNLKAHLQTAFHEMKHLGLVIKGAYFNADMAFDTREARKTCFNYGLILNIPENVRNRQRPKRGRKRLFNAVVYAGRFCAERTFAWADKFKRLLIRFERYDAYFLGAHYLAFTLINLREVLADEADQDNDMMREPRTVVESAS